MLGRFDQFPKLRILLQRFVFLHFQPGPEEKVFQRMTVEDPVNKESKFVTLEIDPIVADAEPMQSAAGPFQFAEGIQLGLHDLLRQTAEFAQDLELQFLGHPGQFGRAGRIKNDLEGAHSS